MTISDLYATYCAAQIKLQMLAEESISKTCEQFLIKLDLYNKWKEIRDDAWQQLETTILKDK